MCAAVAAAPATADAARLPDVACKDGADSALRLDIPVTARDTGEREMAFGYYALPDRRPRGLVIFAHGHGNSAWKWRLNLRNAASELGVIAVAMDYRRQTYPKSDPPGDITTESYGWRVREGAEDSIAAARLFERRCLAASARERRGSGRARGRSGREAERRDGRAERRERRAERRDRRAERRQRHRARGARRLPVVMYGVSMGGNTSGLAVAAGASRRDGTPLFDYWFNIEGVTNVIETYFEARAVAGPPLNNKTGQIAVAEIEEEMGGTFEERPGTYAEHTVVTRADDIRRSGLKGVVMVHGTMDGTVPYNQSEEMFGALAAEGVPTDLFTVVRRGDAPDGQTAEETLTIAERIPGYSSPFAGHGGENDLTHPVIKLGYERLAKLLRAGRRPTCLRRFVVDEGRLSSDPDDPSPVDCRR